MIRSQALTVDLKLKEFMFSLLFHMKDGKDLGNQILDFLDPDIIEMILRNELEWLLLEKKKERIFDKPDIVIFFI